MKMEEHLILPAALPADRQQKRLAVVVALLVPIPFIAIIPFGQVQLPRKDRRVSVRSKLSGELPLVRGHRGQLREVIFNLVHNALEAMETIPTDRPRVLQIGTERRGQYAIAVSVDDSGPGIDPKHLGGIFDAFVTTKAHGMGLGLAICRMIIERHGGQLTASSDGMSGALFEFVLPTGSADEDKTAAPSS